MRIKAIVRDGADGFYDVARQHDGYVVVYGTRFDNADLRTGGERFGVFIADTDPPDSIAEATLTIWDMVVIQ